MTSASRSKLALAVALVLVVSTLLSSGVLLGTSADEETSNFRLSAHPENGRYVTFNESNELQLNLSKQNENLSGSVNENMYLRLDQVFNITYTGSTEADVWINDSASDVTFYRNDTTSDSLEGESNHVTLSPDETVVVGVLVDTRGSSDVSTIQTFDIESKIAESSGGDDDDDDGGDGGAAPSGDTLSIGTKARVSVSNAQPGEPVSVSVGETEPMRDSGVRMESVSLTLSQGGEASLEIDTMTEPRQQPPTGTKALFAYEVSTDLTDDDIDSASVRVKIERERVSNPDAVETLRRTNSGWEEVDTERVDTTTQHYVYEITTGEFSTFAIVERAETTPTTTTPGEQTATQTQTRTTTPGEQTTTQPPTEREPTPTTQTRTQTATEPRTETTGTETTLPIPGFGFVAALLAILAGALAIARRL